MIGEGSTVAFSSPDTTIGSRSNKKFFLLRKTVNHLPGRNKMLYHVRAEICVRTDDRHDIRRTCYLDDLNLFRYSYHIALLKRKFIRAAHELNVSSQKEKIHDYIDRIFTANQYYFLPLEWPILDNIGFAYLQARIDNEFLFL